MSVVASIRSQLVPVHREGYPFIAIFAFATLILYWLSSPLGLIGVGLTIWCALFFRDPERVTPTREGILVAPACSATSR
jgi:phosphatidylserine decarboxylase